MVLYLAKVILHILFNNIHLCVIKLLKNYEMKICFSRKQYLLRQIPIFLLNISKDASNMAQIQNYDTLLNIDNDVKFATLLATYNITYEECIDPINNR
jgi:hypothetical protein